MFPIAKRSLAMIDAFSLGTLRYVFGLTIFAALLWAIEGRQAFRYGTRFWPAIGFGLQCLIHKQLCVYVSYIDIFQVGC